MLYFCCGVPKSGKTSKLISLYEKVSQNGWKCLLLQPMQALSSNRPKIMSRNGKTLASKVVEEVNFDELLEYDAIFIDEAQWLSVKYVEQLSLLGKNVYLFGLRTVNNQGLSPTVKRIMELSDEIEVLPYKCDKCGERNAVISRYIGGSREWLCLCTHCNASYN